MIDKVRSALDGVKTYIIVALFIACVITEKAFGFDIPGFDPGQDWLAYVMAALGLGTLRAGVAKAAT